MRKLRPALISLLVSATIAVAFIQIDDTHDQTVGGTKTHVLPVIGSVTCATLPTMVSGGLQYCADCVAPSSPCIPGGTGAFAARMNGTWQCFPGGNAVIDTPTPQPTVTPQPTATPGSFSSRDGSIWIALAECQGSTASALMDIPASGATPGPVASACDTGTNVQKGVLAYVNSSNLQAQTTYFLPNNNANSVGGFNAGGTTSANIVWYSSTTSGNVVWNLATACVAAGASDDPSFTSNTVTSAAQGTASRLQTATVTLSVGGCSAGDTLHLRLSRDAGSGSDTMAGTANALGIMLNVSRQ